LLAFTTREEIERNETGSGGVAGCGLGVLPRADGLAESGVRHMDDVDLGRILELRSVVRWSADPGAFDLLRGIRDARWAVAEASDGALAGMVGAVPLGRIGILCHLAVHDGYRKMGLGARLSSWAVLYLRSRGAKLVRLYSTRQAEGLYLSLGFRPIAPRTVYRLEEAPCKAREEADGHWVETLSFGRMKGYLMRGSSAHATRIGPFVASSPSVARLLLACALRTGDGSPVEVTVPGSTESPAHELLREFGFTGRQDRLQMELGEETSVRRSGLEHYGTTPYLAT
jgi:GNAT superfamily N-acetyltransferase